MRDRWSPLFRELSLAYGWTPDEIEALTLSQLMHYLPRDAEVGGRWVGPDEVRRLRLERRAMREAWIRDVTEVLRRGISTT